VSRPSSGSRNDAATARTKPGAGALAVLALIAAFALVTGITELVVAISGEKLLERKTKALAPPRTSTKTTPQPSH
jgi:hypothetical protein